MSLSSLDTLNTGTRRGGTGTDSPVRGLRARRDFRSFTLKVPKPRISMCLPEASARDTASRNWSTVSATSFFVRPVRSAISSTISALVIRPSWRAHSARASGARGTVPSSGRTLRAAGRYKVERVLRLSEPRHAKRDYRPVAKRVKAFSRYGFRVQSAACNARGAWSGIRKGRYVGAGMACASRLEIDCRERSYGGMEDTVHGTCVA